MAPKNRKQAKNTVVTAPAASKAKSEKPPEPFISPDENLEPFLDFLDPAHVYITHIDRHPRTLKRNVFIVPIILNAAIALALAWRVKYILPWYWALFLVFLRQPSPLAVDTQRTPWPALINILFTRTFTIFLDYSLFRFLGPWPLDFFVGDKSPSFWRTSIGFREAEVTVRKSRQWDESLPEGWLGHRESGEGKPVWDERILPAVDRDWIRRKTGYLMMDKHWDLDFQAQVHAHYLIGSKKASTRDFEKTVIVHSKPHGWLVWPIARLDEGGNEFERFLNEATRAENDQDVK